jgi:hypothetical protein
MSFKRLACVLVAISAGLSAAVAQQITGNIRGTVSDPSGAVVQSATVTAQQSETSLTRTATTDHGGNYLLVELPVGHYQLEVAAKGFQKYLQEGISLNVNETATVSVRLMLGQETEQVQVRADAELRVCNEITIPYLGASRVCCPWNGRRRHDPAAVPADRETSR